MLAGGEPGEGPPPDTHKEFLLVVSLLNLFNLTCISPIPRAQHPLEQAADQLVLGIADRIAGNVRAHSLADKSRALLGHLRELVARGEGGNDDACVVATGPVHGVFEVLRDVTPLLAADCDSADTRFFVVLKVGAGG
jgi:hypothetical protein